MDVEGESTSSTLQVGTAMSRNTHGFPLLDNAQMTHPDMLRDVMEMKKAGVET